MWALDIDGMSAQCSPAPATLVSESVPAPAPAGRAPDGHVGFMVEAAGLTARVCFIHIAPAELPFAASDQVLEPDISVYDVEKHICVKKRSVPMP